MMIVIQSPVVFLFIFCFVFYVFIGVAVIIRFISFMNDIRFLSYRFRQIRSFYKRDVSLPFHHLQGIRHKW